MTSRRIGLIVPSSNVTMEREIPGLLRAREAIAPERFSVHSARMRMKEVTLEALADMNRDASRCATLLADAEVEAQAYACLVAIMSQGPDAHRRAEASLTEVAGAPVLSSAGALVNALHHLGARRVAMICPYTPALTELVIEYLAAEGIEVVDHLALNIPDNLEVAALDPDAPARLAHTLDTRHAEAFIASACVQMPSLPSIERIEQQLGVPTLSAAVATTWSLLRALNLDPVAPGGGALTRPSL